MVMDEMQKYLAFLEKDLLSRSHGKFAVGEAGVQAIIDVEEMIDVPVKDILKRCYQDLEKAETEIAAVARQIDPNATTTDLVARMRSNHKAPEELHQAIKDELISVRNCLTEYDLMTVPPEMPHVIATPMPDYASGGGMMLTPGPFETVAEESYLALQIPKPDWTQARIDGLWSDFNTYALVLLMIHECYPGHHMQFYLEKRVQLRASKDHDSTPIRTAGLSTVNTCWWIKCMRPRIFSTNWQCCFQNAAILLQQLPEWRSTSRKRRSKKPRTSSWRSRDALVKTLTSGF